MDNALLPQDWERARELFAAALAWPPETRAARLREACAGSPAVLTEVLSLLRFHEQADGFLEDASVLAAAAGLDEPLPALEGRRIGPYRVEREIGQGGMGAVYLAVRDDDQYRRQVAIKLVRQGFETPESLARFRSERQILARLDHPGIARLVDGGTTDGGLPYLVMDYVDGLPITRHCREAGLGPRERVRLFLEVCAAVEHAHRSLVVHRDLKPSNVLVDREGRPRLLDFGIAKFLDPTADDGLAATGTGLRPMTLAYASPEQARGQPVTTATDVYSLGVLLYELLTGRHPYPLDGRPAHEVVRLVCEAEPKPPSAVRTSDCQDSEAARHAAPTSPAARRQLRGDLDTIVLTAMAKSPERRYASVERFSDDLRRHLEGRPVLARGDSVTYRARRFVRRNAAAVVAASLVLMAVVAGTLATASQARQARVAREQAERRYADVRRLAHSLLFDYHDAIEALPGSTPVRQRLVQDALVHLDALAREQPADPVLRRELAAAYERIGKLQGNSFYSNLGDTTGALKSYRKALALREGLLAESADDAALRRELAGAYEGLGDVLWTANDLLGARNAYLRTVAILTGLAAAQPKDRGLRLALATMQASLGDLAGNASYANLGDTAEALRRHEQALAVREAMLREAPGDEELRDAVSESLYHVAGMRRTTGDLDGAVEHYRRALAMQRALAEAHSANGERARLVAATRNALAQVLEESGRFEEAVTERSLALETAARLLAADPLNTKRRRALAVFERGLASLAVRGGHSDQALARARRALAASEELARLDATNADARRELFASHRLLAWVYESRAAWPEANDAYRHAVRLAEELLAPLTANAQARADLATALQGLGTSLCRAGAGSGGLGAEERRSRRSPHGTSDGLRPALEPDGGLGAEEIRSRRSPHGTGAGFTPATEPDGGLGAEEIRSRRSPHGTGAGFTPATEPACPEALRRAVALRAALSSGDPTSALARHDLAAARAALADALDSHAANEACRERAAAVAGWQALRDGGRLRAIDAPLLERSRLQLARCPRSASGRQPTE